MYALLLYSYGCGVGGIMVNFTLNGKTVSAEKGETILNVARKEGVYIPTMCYLEKCTSVGSCRLCVVDVEGVEGQILSCQTPPTEGIVVHTNSDALEKSRQDIMKLYDVNHPLECGVCDKSGACDLQNKSLELGVHTQNFTAREQNRKIEHWGLINYDPTLCIMCEKCTHVCNEIIGDDAIDVKFGGYSSTIIPKNADTLDCTFCGECIAVCPVGALVSSDFQYKANAWELNKVPSTCAHCSAGCALEYEVKHTSIDTMSEQSIYRVNNDFEYTTLCGAGRFGFDFENRKGSKDETVFTTAVEKLKSANSINFTSMITNEEAYLLQELHVQNGTKLYNDEALALQNFLKAYSSTSGKSLYNGKLSDIASSDNVIVLGSRISTDNPQVRYNLTMATKRNKATITYMHPIEDALLQNSITQFSKYEVGTEEGVMALLGQVLLADTNMDEATKKFFSDLDEGYLSAETNIGEEEFETISKAFKKAKKSTLVLGEDLFTHKRAENIAKIAGLIELHTNMNVVIIPSEVNSLGVALICELEAASGIADFGYNAPADYVASASKGDIMMPALNQQEGTVTSIDKVVLPLNVAIDFDGYTLLDLCKATGVSRKKYTVDITKELPQNAGFAARVFDSLENYLAHNGQDVRGYVLTISDVASSASLEGVETLPEFNGTIIYNCNPVLQFNHHTQATSQLNDKATLKGSAQFANIAKISDGEKVIVKNGTDEFEASFELDASLKGTVALMGSFENELNYARQNYRFEKVNIMKGSVNE